MIKKYIDDIFFTAGVGFISAGGFMIYVPAGFIILGICCIAYAFIFARITVKGGG